MKEERARSRWRRLAKYLAAGVVLLLLIFGALSWYITTDSFQAMVRRRLIAELEQITGGTAEVGRFHVVPLRFRVEVADLTIHGREGLKEVPYIHADRLIAQVKIISTFRTKFGFHRVVIDHPTVHILVYPDGTTNQPGPRSPSASANNSVQQLFSLSINQLEVRHGTLLWNDQVIPIDFAVNDLAADMTYSLLQSRYDGNVLLGKVDTKFSGYRPFSWTAEAHFSLGRNTVEVRSFRATSGRSRLSATGKLQDFNRPDIQGSYDATVDLAEAAAIARRPEVRSGVLQASGNASWNRQTYASAGKLSVTDLDWRDSNIQFSNASFASGYSLDPVRVSFFQGKGKFLGGTAAGTVAIVNWQAGARHKSKIEQKGSARLAFQGMSVAEVAQALSVSGLPLQKMRLAGSAEGTLDARWTGGPQNTEATMAVDIAAPAGASPIQLAVNAHARATYRHARRELEVAEFNASTHSSQLRASGVLSSKTALRLTGSTTDLNEWQRILSSFRGPMQIPITLHGRATFNGTATGRFPDVTLAGLVQVEDFDSLIPATAETPERQIHWDSLTAGLQLSPRSIVVHNASLRREATGIAFELTAGLQNYEFTPVSNFSGRIDMDRAEVSAILALAGYSYPLTGTMDLHFEASGTRAEPHGEGSILLTDATFYGEPVRRFSSNLRLEGQEGQLNDISLSYREARVTGSAAHNFSSRISRFNLAGTNFDLASMPGLQNKRVAIAGQMDFALQGQGTLQEPQINGSVHLRRLVLNQELAGDFTMEAETQGSDLHFTGHSQFEEAQLELDGRVNLRDDWPATIKARFDHLDVDSLLQAYLKGRLSGHSSIAGEMQLQGPLRRPREMSITGNLSEVSLAVQDVQLRNDGPVRFSVTDRLFKLEQFHLTGERTDLTGSGTVQLAGDRLIDLHAHGRVNLRLIESFNHDFSSAGVVNIDMAVNGSVSRPVAHGQLQISNGSLSYIDLPSGVSQMNGTLTFNQDRVQIENLTAYSGGGAVTFGGFATYHNQLLSFDLTVHADAVRLRYPPGVSSTADADLRLVGSSEGSTLSGDVTVNKLSITPGFDFAAYLARSSQTSALPETNPLLNRIHLDLHIVTTPELQMQTAIVRLSGDADLRLRGTVAKPALLGRADVIEGELYFNGTKYHLERGDVTFVSPVTIKPFLDLQMSTRVRDYDITVSLNGDLSKLNLNYRSEPPLPEADIVALLALGRTREESAQLQQSGQSAFSQEASNAILSEALNATVSNRVQRLFGGSRIKIDPQGVSTETNPARGPQVTIEQQVTNELTLTYSTNVSQTSQQIIQVQYNLSRNVSVVAVRDQNGVVSFDVRIRQRKK